MSLGVRYDIGSIHKGDTAELYAAVHQRGVPLTAEELDSVQFIIQQPNGELSEPEFGEILDDGRGYLRWEDTEELGDYAVQAQFVLGDGEVTSILLNFAVNDPFKEGKTSAEDIVIEDVWMRLEDAFDSIEGGPWLRDETRSQFDESKIGRYIGETLLDINVQMPPTNMEIDYFTTPQPNGIPNEVLPLLSKGVLCRVIRHLIRSYIEQPVPQGAQVVWNDRTRYWQAWEAVYKSEHEDYITMVRLWKRGFLHFGHSALLISSKGGRLYNGTQFRLWNVGRGYGF